jgi:hypothetical protein
VALEPELAGLLARAMEFRRRHKRDKKRDKWEAITREWFGRGGDADDLGLNGDVLCWVGPLCKGGDPVLCTIEATRSLATRSPVFWRVGEVNAGETGKIPVGDPIGLDKDEP